MLSWLQQGAMAVKTASGRDAVPGSLMSPARSISLAVASRGRAQRDGLWGSEPVRMLNLGQDARAARALAVF